MASATFAVKLDVAVLERVLKAIKIVCTEIRSASTPFAAHGAVMYGQGLAHGAQIAGAISAEECDRIFAMLNLEEDAARKRLGS